MKPDFTMPAGRQVIRWIVVLVFAMSAGYAFWHQIHPSVDASAYDQVGWNIAQGKGFRLTLDVPIEEDEVITYQGPLYQVFLAGIYSVAGHSYPAVWIVQAFLRAMTALLIYLICLKIFGEEKEGMRIGWLAAVFFGFYPDLIEVGAMLMTETLFIFLSVLVVWLFYRQYDKPEIKASMLLGAGFGLTILSRSSILLFGLAFAVWYWRKRAIVPFIAFCFTAGLVLVPWTVRNAMVYQQFIPTMANAGYNMWVGNREGASGEGGNPVNLPDYQKQYGMTGANTFFVGRFRAFVSEHPIQYVSLSAGRFVKYFSVIRPLGFWFYQDGLPKALQVMSSAIASIFLFVFGFAGAWMAWKTEKNEKLRYLTAFAFLTAFPVIMIIISTRYRIPIYPLFAIIGAFAVTRLVSDPKRYGPIVVGAIGFVTLIAGIDTVQSIPKVLSHMNDLKT